MGGTSAATDAAQVATALAQAPALKDLLARLEPGPLYPVLGVSPAAHPLLAAACRLASRQPVLIVTETLRQQESTLQDLQTWLGGHPQRPRILFFPEWEVQPHEGKLPHVDVISDRVATLVGLTAPSEAAPVVVTSLHALLQRTFPPTELASRLLKLEPRDIRDPLDLVEWLEAQGYEPEAQVTQKGTLSLRGGIVDVWPPAAPWPVRIEFFGDEVESLREFDPLTQLSRERLHTLTLTPAGELGLLKGLVAQAASPRIELATLIDYLPAGTLLLLSEPEVLQARADDFQSRAPAGDVFTADWKTLLEAASRAGHRLVGATEADALMLDEGHPLAGARAPVTLPMPSLEFIRPLARRAPEPAVAEAQRREFFHQIHRWLRGGLKVHVFCNNEGEQQRFGELWEEHGLGRLPDAKPPEAGNPAPASGTHDRPLPPPAAPAEPVDLRRLRLHLGALGRGFLCEDAGFVVVSDAEIFGRYKVLRPRRLKSPHAQVSRSLLDIDFTEFEEGDYVVHVEHGIGRFIGLQTSPATPGHRGVPGTPGIESLVIEYAAADPQDSPPRLYVPVSEAHLVSKYVGAGKARPPLNTLGGTRWAKAKKDAERAVADLAAELLEVQAARESQPGHAYPADHAWQREFEAAFIYEETPDQVRAIQATREDLERPRPMDRLICGDVGFGKTEVAIRAAFKVVMGGRQVAVLVPTTVLAQQHYNTFRERMSDYPVQVEILSRFQSRREQRATLERLANGTADIVIGTHRLLQKDVQFRELGMVVVDEEQRFGVMHKERFKMLRRTVDVLTLSATPIPRTLYLALSGARDMSTIETPPQDRLPVETIVSAYDERLIRDAIHRELNRQGQVFFLHNRVTTIDQMALKLRALVPEARIVIGHGQMDPDELEEVMTRFVNGEADVLLSTTIIESGLDIPNANTIIIDRADRFGLSELYQLRGRVGRYKHQAYAYLLLPRHAQLLSEARKRISAIRQYSSLGSGFKIAMRDLEIRGAGNLLGSQQSGHITAVGFDLYCQLLKQSISALKGEKPAPRVDVQVRLDFLALNPAEEAVPSMGRGRDTPAEAPELEDPDEPASTHPDPNLGAGAPDAKTRLRPAAGLPASYIPDSRQRIDLHRRFAQVTTPVELRRLRDDLRDRFGPPPPAVELFLQVAELRLFAGILGITAIETREDRLMLTRNGAPVQLGGRYPRLMKKEPKARLNEIRRFLGSLPR